MEDRDVDARDELHQQQHVEDPIRRSGDDAYLCGGKAAYHDGQQPDHREQAERQGRDLEDVEAQMVARSTSKM